MIIVIYLFSNRSIRRVYEYFRGKVCMDRRQSSKQKVRYDNRKVDMNCSKRGIRRESEEIMKRK